MSGEERLWYYMDSTGQEFGPYPSSTMKGWFQQNFFPMQGELQVRLDDMPEGTHYYIKDLYPHPIMERAFDGEPNLPSGGGSRGAKRGGKQQAAAAAPAMDALGANPYDPAGLGAAALWGMPGMMPGMMPGGMQPGMPFGFPPMRPGMPGMMPGMMGPGAATGRFQGRIKSFNVQKGFGFIECPEAHQVYGRDVFLHKAQIGGFQIGSQVSFAVEMNKQTMPQARDLLESDMLAGFGGGLMGMPGMGMPGGKGFNNPKAGGKGKGGNKGRGQGGQAGAKKKPAPKKEGGNPGGAAPAAVPAMVQQPED